MITLDIVQEGGDWDSLGDVTAVCAAAAEEAGRVGGARDGEASLLLTDDDALRQLNRRWRGQDHPTNVLSFPAADMPAGKGRKQLGDIAVAFETLTREAREAAKTPADHLAHLVVHGILHLLGLDHLHGDEADAMEALEIEVLAAMGIANPYAGTVPADDANGAAAPAEMT